MAQLIRTTRRLEAWRFARKAIRAYEREQSPSSSRQVERAMRLLRETQAEALLAEAVLTEAEMTEAATERKAS